MILLFLQVFITPRYKERGFLVSIVKFYGIRRNLGKSSGAFFRKKIVLFSISSREELSLKALKTSQRLTLLIASYFFLMNTHVQVLIMRTLPLAWVYPEVRNFFERKICPIVSDDRENILFPEGRGGGNTYWYYKIFLEKKGVYSSWFYLLLQVLTLIQAAYDERTWSSWLDLRGSLKTWDIWRNPFKCLGIKKKKKSKKNESKK